MSEIVKKFPTAPPEQCAPQETVVDRFRFTDFADLKASAENDYLIKGLIPRGERVVVWGRHKCGKSFVITDAMLHVAYGWDYRGRRVQQGRVVYIAGEGQKGFGKRAEAFRLHHEAACEIDPPFHLIADCPNLVNDRDALLEAIRGQCPEDDPPAAVVLDTLNRTAQGSDSDEDLMSDYTAAADHLVHELGCTVIVIHHCGWNEDRLRGSTILPGWLDVEISVKRASDDTITIAVEHAKDMDDDAELHCRLEQVEVIEDEDGDWKKSCVVVPAEAPASKEKPVTGQAKTALDQLTNLIADQGQLLPASKDIPEGVWGSTLEDWKQRCYRAGISTSTDSNTRWKAFDRAWKSLRDKGLVRVWDEWVWLV